MAAPPQSNIMLLPQLAASFIVTTNGGWYDTISFVSFVGGPPLDLTGMNFHAEMRLSVQDPGNKLDMSTAQGTLLNGGINGQMLFNVPAASMAKLSSGLYVMDILATDIGTSIVRNLFEAAPANVTVIEGITR